MIAKIHRSPSGIILALCDTELLGKKFEEGEAQLDLSGPYFRGVEMTEREILPAAKAAKIITLVGQRSVDFFIAEKIAHRENVKKISGIPHLQIFRD